jgi:hypothetical protein
VVCSRVVAAHGTQQEAAETALTEDDARHHRGRRGAARAEVCQPTGWGWELAAVVVQAEDRPPDRHSGRQDRWVRRRCCFAQLQVLHIQDSVILDSMTCRFGFS